MTLKEISRQELKDRLDGGKPVLLIDVLEPRSYQYVHLPGAVNIDATRDDFVERVEAAAPDRHHTMIVVYDASRASQLSTKAAERLRQAGYLTVLDYKGGLSDWAAAGYRLDGTHVEEVRRKLLAA